jgi:signal transduction histidine kinase
MSSLSNSPVRRAKLADRKKSSRTGTPTAAPSTKNDLSAWAGAHVYAQLGTVAWQGHGTPLSITSFHPANSYFIKTCFDNSPLNRDWSEYIHPLDKAKATAFFSAALSSAKSAPANLDYRIIDKNGSIIWVRHTINESLRKGREVHMLGFLTEIQREKEFEMESLRVSEREQNRIGQDLHDDLCQVLAGVSCLMRVVEDRIAKKVPEEVSNLAEINQQIIDAMHRTRALTHGLFPGKILIADIRGSLLELAAQIKTRFKVEITTQFTGRFPKHSSDQIIQIYRLAQEAITNSIKHGRATQITVRLEAHPSAMELTVADNGTGLDLAGSPEGGVGLHIMRNRASILGGGFSIKNGPQGGAVARLEYPFQN